MKWKEFDLAHKMNKLLIPPAFMVYHIEWMVDVLNQAFKIDFIYLSILKAGRKIHGQYKIRFASTMSFWVA